MALIFFLYAAVSFTATGDFEAAFSLMILVETETAWGSDCAFEQEKTVNPTTDHTKNRQNDFDLLLFMLNIVA